MDYLKEPGGDEKRKTGVGISYNSFDWNETDKDDDIETEVKEEKFSLKKSRVIKKKIRISGFPTEEKKTELKAGEGKKIYNWWYSIFIWKTIVSSCDW